MEQSKKEIIYEIGKPILNPLGWFSVVALLVLMSFPFVWMWVNLWLAIKVSITAFISLVILTTLYRFIEKHIRIAVDKEFKENPPSNFKLMMEKRLNKDK